MKPQISRTVGVVAGAVGYAGLLAGWLLGNVGGVFFPLLAGAAFCGALVRAGGGSRLLAGAIPTLIAALCEQIGRASAETTLEGRELLGLAMIAGAVFCSGMAGAAIRDRLARRPETSLREPDDTLDRH